MIPPEQLAPLNKSIDQWGKRVAHLIIQDMHAKGVRHRADSHSRTAIFLLVKSSLKKKFGAPERLGITFPKHLVYVKYGVGKHRPKGSGKEDPKDIVDNIIEQHFGELADLVQNHYADIIMNGMFIDKTRGI